MLRPLAPAESESRKAKTEKCERGWFGHGVRFEIERRIDTIDTNGHVIDVAVELILGISKANVDANSPEAGIRVKDCGIRKLAQVIGERSDTGSWSSGAATPIPVVPPQASAQNIPSLP